MNNRPFSAVLIYLVLALAWILVSDQLTRYLAVNLDTDNLIVLQSIKGLLFVFATSGFLYFIIKKQQKDLLKSEQQYRSLFESNPNPMWIYNRSTYKFVEINDAAIDKYGYSREEFLNMTIHDIRPPEDKEKLTSFIKNSPSQVSNSGNWRHIKKSGEEFIASIKSFSVTFNNQACAMVLAIDNTEKFTRQKQLEESYKKEIELNDALATHIDLIKKSNEENRRMAEIINKINNFVIITGKDGSLKWVNKAFTQFTGYSMADMEGQNPVYLLSGPRTDTETIGSLIDHLDRQEFISVELINYTKDKQEYWVQIDMSPIYDEQGGLESFIFVESLITERKLREEKIQQQNAALRQLAWISSHEIRRPVTSIIGLINLIKNLENGSEKQECLKLLEECSTELDNLIKDIAKRVNLAEDEQPLV